MGFPILPPITEELAKRLDTAAQGKGLQPTLTTAKDVAEEIQRSIDYLNHTFRKAHSQGFQIIVTDNRGVRAMPSGALRLTFEVAVSGAPRA